LNYNSLQIYGKKILFARKIQFTFKKEQIIDVVTDDDIPQIPLKVPYCFLLNQMEKTGSA